MVTSKPEDWPGRSALWQAILILHPRARPDRHGHFAAGLRRRADHDGRVSRPPLTCALRRPARQITTGPVPDQGPQGAVVVAATWAAGSPTLTSLRTAEPGPRVRTVTTERYWKDTKTGDAEQAGARDPAAATPAGAALIRSAAPRMDRTTPSSATSLPDLSWRHVMLGASAR